MQGNFQERILEWLAISLLQGIRDTETEPGPPALHADSLLSEPLKLPTEEHSVTALDLAFFFK